MQALDIRAVGDVQGVIVPYGHHGLPIVAADSGRTLSAQTRAIMQACAALSKKHAAKRRSDRAKVFDGMREPLATGGTNLGSITIPGQHVRAVSEPDFAHVRITDDAAKFVAM